MSGIFGNCKNIYYLITILGKCEEYDKKKNL